MVYRASWLAGIFALGLTVVRINELLRPTRTGAPWQLVVIAATLLGAVLTWTLLAFRVGLPWVALANAAALLITVSRIAAPDTTFLIFPTRASLSGLWSEVTFASDLVRSATPPVIPFTGLVVVVAATMWMLGAVLVAGLSTGRPYVALLPPLAFYLQLATLDRQPASSRWTVALLVALAASLAAVAHDERTAAAGRMARSGKGAAAGSLRWLPVSLLATLVVLALTTTSALAGVVPRSGVLTWRNPTGFGSTGYFGGVSFNPFISIQRSLVAPSNVPVFTARIDGDVDPTRVYWRLLTMDSFNGTYWHASDPKLSIPDEEPFERSGYRFAGPTTEVVQHITIAALQNEWLPAVYSPTQFASNLAGLQRNVRHARDGSLAFPGGQTDVGWSYSVRSQMPVPDLDALAFGDDGELTQMFRRAVDEGDLSEPDPAAVVLDPGTAAEPPDVERWVELPADLDPRIAELAEEITRGMQSEYERALALEDYFRNPENGFRYDTSVLPASGSDDLATWLFDSTSDDSYRIGYCEQFATSMGVMARALGIPTRVVLGFTPGRIQNDGTIVVTDANAHAWVELWMPSQGWMRFDPTPRSDSVNPSTVGELAFDIAPYLEVAPGDNRLLNLGTLPGQRPFEDPAALPGGSTGDTTAPGDGLTIPRWLFGTVLWIIIVAVVALGVPTAKWIRRRRRMARLADGDVAAAWAEITERLGDLGVTSSAAATPLEVARENDPAMATLAAVYSEALYGPGDGRLTHERVRAAEESYHATTGNIATRFPPSTRLFAWWRVRSLLPDWWQGRRPR